MKTKKIKDLLPGETFIDSIGTELTTIKTEELPPIVTRKVKVTFKSPSGYVWTINYKADKIVEVK